MGGFINDNIKSFRRDLVRYFREKRLVLLAALEKPDALLWREVLRQVASDAKNCAAREIVAPQSQ